MLHFDFRFLVVQQGKMKRKKKRRKMKKRRKKYRCYERRDITKLLCPSVLIEWQIEKTSFYIKAFMY